MYDLSVREFIEWLLAYRAEPSTNEEDRRLLAIRVAVVLITIGGSTGLAIIPVANVSHVKGYHPVGIAVPCAFALGVIPLAWFSRDRISWRIIYAFGFVTPVLISVGQYYAGGQLPLGALLYLLVAMYAFLFLGRRAAVAVTALIGVLYSLVLALGRQFAAPVEQWMFLMITLVVTATVFDWLVNRTRSLGEAERQARVDLQAAHEELEQWNRSLEQRVLDQIDQLQAMGELRRFLSPQVADAVIGAVSSGKEGLLEPHRRLISVFFCDLRGFTRFAASADPEEVMEVLNEYYEALGTLITRYEATVGAFAGDGLMAYFNDPVPCADPALRAVEMAVTSREMVQGLSQVWRAKGYDLGYGVGVGFGYATLGTIGFEGRRDYGPVGTVVNLASRLCDHAADGEILLGPRCFSAVATAVDAKPRGTLTLKGFSDPVPVHSVDRIRAGYTSTDARQDILAHLDSEHSSEPEPLASPPE